MPLANYLNALRDEWAEARDATRHDANLNRLRAADPDAARIFTVTFTQARDSLDLQIQLSNQMQEYAAIKNRQGRMDLYDQIYA